jgi:pimeloyl-ACP methyl ester carboxylesterase
MELFHRKYGENKPPFIIVHGLYGASDNWVTLGKKLSEYFEVYILDQRNHGKSPHSNEHNYDVMADDIFEFMKLHNIEKAVLLGHSMGGKTVMTFAGKYPEMVSALIVVDISPAKYSIKKFSDKKIEKHQKIIQALNDKSILQANTRAEADNICKKYINESQTRAFILKNLKRGISGFEWKLNVEIITKNIENILSDITLENDISGFPTIFIKAENSDYITENDIKVINKVFPAAEIITINNAGHWVHTEQPALFLNAILSRIYF